MRLQQQQPEVRRHRTPAAAVRFDRSRPELVYRKRCR